MRRLLPAPVRRAGRRLRNLLRNKAAVLIYHRISDSPSDPYLIRVTPQHLAEHLQALRGLGYPISLRELAGCLGRGRVPDRAIALTFDDGYVDNLLHAKPLLERYQVPATVYVTAGDVGRDREFWWDELEQLLLSPEGQLPPVLRLALPGQPKRTWQLSPVESHDRQEAGCYRDWTVLAQADPTPRHRALRELHAVLRPLPPEQQRQALDQLWAQLERRPVVREEYRAMQAQEARELVRGGLVEVGAHTLSHPLLPAQRPQVQREEIRGSKSRLEEWLGGTVHSFSYPFGEYNARTIAEVRAAGFECACACDESLVLDPQAVWRIPRVDVFDWDGQEFARRLGRLLHG